MTQFLSGQPLRVRCSRRQAFLRPVGSQLPPRQFSPSVLVLIVEGTQQEAIIAWKIIAKYAMMPHSALFIVNPALEIPCARSLARPLALDVVWLNIFRLLKALP